MKRAKQKRRASPKRAPKSHGFTLPLSLEPMEARTERDLPAQDGEWQYEPKWDGFRCLAFKEGKAVDLRARSGKPLGRFFPEIVAALRDVPVKRFVVDGELVIEIEGRLSFDALQLRLHPAASRILRLSTETPARLVLFDMLATPDGKSLTSHPLRRRRQALETFLRRVGTSRLITLSPVTDGHDEAKRWLRQSGEGWLDGVIAKRADGAYESGERAMIKVKKLRTADCVVGGFRYQGARRQVGSLLLGLYDDEGKLDHVGFTSTIADKERRALTDRLEALRHPPGFTGNAPGSPSRWSTARSTAWEPLRPKLVVEVRFDHVTGRRFRHGTKLLRWRPDKAPRQCTFVQIARDQG
ncbi:MAG TPA: ATP-dependent DNA ligase [Xanthobacteraceae bacterium]